MTPSVTAPGDTLVTPCTVLFVNWICGSLAWSGGNGKAPKGHGRGKVKVDRAKGGAVPLNLLALIPVLFTALHFATTCQCDIVICYQSYLTVCVSVNRNVVTFESRDLETLFSL